MESQQASGTPGAQRKCQCKLVLLGESGVGKSNLVLQFVQGQFVEHQESTIGAAFLTQTVVLNNTLIKFEIWDTAGQERYRSLAPMYYRGAQAAIVVYDITQNISFEKAKQWVKELKRRATQNIVIALAGNKADLPNRRVTEEEVQAYADQNNLISFETSAKTGHNVRRLFEELAARLPDTLTPELPSPNAVNVSAGGAAQNQEPEQGGMCC